MSRASVPSSIKSSLVITPIVRVPENKIQKLILYSKIKVHHFNIAEFTKSYFHSMRHESRLQLMPCPKYGLERWGPSDGGYPGDSETKLHGSSSINEEMM